MQTFSADETSSAQAGTNRVRGAEPWTAEYLAFVLPLRPEQVLRCDGDRGADPVSRLEWAWIDTAQRLTWLYGADEALRRLNGSVPSGDDPEPMAVAA